MSWENLLQTDDEFLILPWVGHRTLFKGVRSWNIVGRLPAEHGWYKFKVNGRNCSLVEKADADPEIFGKMQYSGYLVGDHVVLDNSRGLPEFVFLLDEEMPRFTRVKVGTINQEWRAYFHVFLSLDAPKGPEEEVLDAFLNRRPDLGHIKNVDPALQLAFTLENRHRDEVEERRRLLEKQRAEEEARRVLEAKKQELIKATGDGQIRRQLAQIDFAAAATAALKVGNATYLDHRRSANRGEMVVQYRLNNRRFECVCDAVSLRIVDAGICLNDYRTGTKGDTFYTLESLPGVVDMAQRTGKLVVFRRVDEYEENQHHDNDDEDWDD